MSYSVSSFRKCVLIRKLFPTRQNHSRHAFYSKNHVQHLQVLQDILYNSKMSSNYWNPSAKIISDSKTSSYPVKSLKTHVKSETPPKGFKFLWEIRSNLKINFNSEINSNSEIMHPSTEFISRSKPYLILHITLQNNIKPENRS